jgi:hypothetical protein
VAGDGGRWLRREVLSLSQMNGTPVDFWLSMPLRRLRGWIEDSIHVHKALARRG